MATSKQSSKLFRLVIWTSTNSLVTNLITFHVAENRKFINGAFFKKVYDKNDSLLIGVGIQKDKFIQELQALTADDRGFVNLTIGTQKTDKNKYSLWLDDRSSRGAASQPGYKPAPKQSSVYGDQPQGGAVSYGIGTGVSIDDLPF